MKVLLLTSQKRIKKYSPLETLPFGRKLIYLHETSGNADILTAGNDTDGMFKRTHEMVWRNITRMARGENAH